jgi:hypothetical protein
MQGFFNTFDAISQNDDVNYLFCIEYTNSLKKDFPHHRRPSGK